MRTLYTELEHQKQRGELIAHVYAGSLQRSSAAHKVWQAVEEDARLSRQLEDGLMISGISRLLIHPFTFRHHMPIAPFCSGEVSNPCAGSMRVTLKAGSQVKW